MPCVIDLQLEGDGCWPDLAARPARIIRHGGPIHLAGLAAGMASGKPSVTLRLDLPGDRVVIAETSLALLLTVADALKARYGDPR